MTEIHQTSLFPPRTVAELVEDIEKLFKEIQELYCLDEIPWVIGYSGGKDSTSVFQLIWNAIATLPPMDISCPYKNCVQVSEHLLG